MNQRIKLTAQHSVALGLVVAFAYAGGWFLTGAGLFAIVAYLVFENHYRLGQADALAEQLEIEKKRCAQQEALEREIIRQVDDTMRSIQQIAQARYTLVRGPHERS